MDDGMDVADPDMDIDDVAVPAAQDIASAPPPVANMIGDFFGNGFFVAPSDSSDTNGSLPIAGGDRRYKVSDNLSPFPTNRVFFNFHQFNNAVTDINNNSRDVTRYTFGVEKTFWCDRASVEVRVPFVEGLNSDQTLDGRNNMGTEFGNVVIVPKVLLYDCCGTYVSAGMGVSVPTADDARLFDDVFLEAAIRNEAVNLTPYVGFFKDYGCGDGWFMQGYAAVDFEASHNTIVDYSSGDRGEIEASTLLSVDWQIGKWIYRNDCCCGGIAGIAPVLELHYTTTLDNGDTPSGFSDEITSFGSADILNLTAGVKVEVGCGMLNVYGAAPLHQTERFIGDSVKQVSFDSEIGVQYIRFF